MRDIGEGLSEPAEPHEDTLELALRRRLAEVVAGAAATEAELRRLAEQGEALSRGLQAAADSGEAHLEALATEPDASIAELASELRRVEGLRAELEALRPILSALDGRARELRGSWINQN